jgi:hypothetical protein
MDIGGKRERVIVTREGRTVTVERQSLYDMPTTVSVYRPGNYPALPADWHAMRNADTTEVSAWLYALSNHTPDRNIDPSARKLGSARTAAKSEAARANGAKGGRPKKTRT